MLEVGHLFDPALEFATGRLVICTRLLSTPALFSSPSYSPGILQGVGPRRRL